MILLGLAGAAGSGKDTVADYLVRRYGFLKFSFSDALYREVCAAWDVADESWLRDRANKDTKSPAFSLEHCGDEEFVKIATGEIDKIYPSPKLLAPWKEPLSPRQILQWWGTEYRRAQDADYWIKQAEVWIARVWAACQYPEHRPQLFVNTSVRFPNERAWVHGFTNGQVWHMRREGLAAVNTHVSETPLPVLHDELLALEGREPKRVFERELYNNDTVDRLYYGVELLLQGQAKFVKVEPMLQDTISQPHEVETFGKLAGGVATPADVLHRGPPAVQDIDPEAKARIAAGPHS